VNWDAFKDLIWDNAIEAALAQLFAALPFLNFWPVNLIIRYIIMKFGDFAYESITLVIDTTVIPLKNKELQREFTVRAISLRSIAKSGGIQSEEFKDARVIHKADLSKYLRVGPRAA
jgi:hypothetical protein